VCTERLEDQSFCCCEEEKPKNDPMVTWVTDTLHRAVSMPKQEQKEKRLSWPETWCDVAKTIAERSYDPRLKVGAIIVSEDNTQLLSLGYNGNYRGGPNKPESLEPGKSGMIHAEVNALIKCDYNFPKRKHMYVTHSPCRDCAKLIINADIARVVYDIPYRDASGLDLLRSTRRIEVLSVDEAILIAGR
jgi:dCMP deaminase